MISKTYYRYIWLLDTLLNSCPLTIEEINMLWEDCPLSNGPIPLRTFHEQRKGIKEMFGVEIVCDRSHGNVYYVKNPDVLDHKSQSEGKSKYGEFAEFTYRLYVTQEFVSQLLAMGDKVEVLEPEELREEMNKRITAMFNFYE